MMTKKLIVLALICLLVLPIVVSLRSLFQPMRPVYAPVGHAMKKFEELADFLRKYYASIGACGEEFRSSAVVTFLENECGRFSSHISSSAQVPPHLSPYDFGVYLCLPVRLQTNLSALIAYTTPLQSQQGKRYRVALFLKDENLVVISLPDDILAKIEGDGADMKQPDFYYRHLESTVPAGSQTESEQTGAKRELETDLKCAP